MQYNTATNSASGKLACASCGGGGGGKGGGGVNFKHETLPTSS